MSLMIEFCCLASSRTPIVLIVALPLKCAYGCTYKHSGLLSSRSLTNVLQSCYNLVMSAVETPHAFIREAVYLHEIARLSDADIARATGVARSTARAWLAQTRSPTGERAERLIELSALVERLARVMEPSYIAVWLRKPVQAPPER